MKNFIAQQLIFLVAISTLFGISCKNDSEDSKEDQKAKQKQEQKKKEEEKFSYFGIYQATLPCKDCDGIIVKLELQENGNYRLIKNYIEKDSVPGNIITETGKFAKEDSILSIENQKFVIANNYISWEDPSIDRLATDAEKSFSMRLIEKEDKKE